MVLVCYCKFKEVWFYDSFIIFKIVVIRVNSYIFLNVLIMCIIWCKYWGLKNNKSYEVVCCKLLKYVIFII